MEKKDDEFKILWFTLLFVGLFAAVLIDYLEDGCISGMGGGNVCGSIALHETVMFLFFLGFGALFTVFSIIKQYLKNRREKAD